MNKHAAMNIGLDENVTPNSGEQSTSGVLEKLMTGDYGQLLLREREQLFEKIYAEENLDRQIQYFALYSLLFSAIYGFLQGMKNLRVAFVLSFVSMFLLFASMASAELADEDRTLSPYFLVRSEGDGVEQFPLLFTSTEVNIAGVIADVKVTQVYKNEGESAIEAIYVFPASTRAAVYGMTMTIGERVIEAKVKEREQARQEYEQAKEEGKTASLLEQERPNVFQMNVANILPGDTIKVELRYTELLVPTDGVYEFVYPTVVGPRYAGSAGVSPAKDADGTSGLPGEEWVANPYLPSDSAQDRTQGEKPLYLFDIRTNISAGMPIQEISCSSHTVNIDYKGAATATVTLDDVEITEIIRQMEPEHLEGIKEAFKGFYIGEDMGSVPTVYKKLFQVGVAYAQEPGEQGVQVQRRTVKEFGGDRDYILRYRLAGGNIESGLLLYQGEPTPNPSQEGKQEGTISQEGNQEGSFSQVGDENFFLLMVQPPQRVKPEDIPPREYIFIVDVSGSMRGFPLNVSKKLLQNLIANLRPTDTFNVLLFAGDSSVMSKHSLPATQKNIKRAIKLIDRQRGGGGTELLPALERVLKFPKAEGVSRTIVIATDGYVRVETRAFDMIRGHLNNANMFTFGIGSSVNRFLIEGMARIGLGVPFIITEPNQAVAKAEEFRKYIEIPVLTGIETDFDDFEAYDVEPVSIPDVLAERPVILFGKWRGQPKGNITLTGFSGKEQYIKTFDVDDAQPSAVNSALRYLWARKRIELLGDYNALSENDERKQEITTLGLTYNLLTQYTSFIAVTPEVRRKNDQVKTVKQPLPLPTGVSNQAIGGEPVPEPTTIVLLGSGLIGILAFSRRYRKK